MTMPSIFAADPGPMVVDPAQIAMWSDVARREGNRHVRRGALITAACVVAGLAVAAATLPPLQTPVSVSETFFDASITQDWSAAWNVICTPSREAIGGVAIFAERAANVNEYYMAPSEVDVEITAIERAKASTGPALRMAVSLTSDERDGWVDRGELLVVRENGEFRVCPLAVSD